MANERIDSLFVKQARATPDRTAVLHQGRETSYRELDHRSTQIAKLLASKGVGESDLIALCMYRNTDMIACMLGILKAGAAYVPLDPEYPQERIDYILKDSAARMVLTTTEHSNRLLYGGELVCINECESNLQEVEACSLQAKGDASSLAYVIYTSGTTGRPKGVMLSHTASALVTWAAQAFTEHELSCVAATSSICFDPSVLEIFVPLCLGGSVLLKLNSLEHFADNEYPSMINVVPAVLEQLLKGVGLPKSIRIINVGGERLRASLARHAYSQLPDVRLFNHYGPTEATTCTTVELVDAESTEDPSIGQPICNARVYVLDERGEPVAIGVTGELYIAGPTLAKGYWNQPELTAERFLKDLRFSSEKMYKTGDLGCLTSKGGLSYLGRVDDQVKFRGVRIELSEIETTLMASKSIINAAAAVRVDPTGRERLIAYIETSAQIDTRDLRQQLEKTLPRSLLPSHFVTLKDWPRNLSGKTDRYALPAPDWEPQSVSLRSNNSLEDVIADCFRYTTGVQRVDPDDNFFEIGGDSLLAEEVMLQLEHILGVSIAASMFSHNPTPRLLAKACSVKPLGSSLHVVALQPTGHKPPLFCTPDVFGLPLSFTSLARAFGPVQPVYGLSVGSWEQSVISKPSVEFLTSVFIKEVRKIQPEGPYRICGYSFGGTAAFDLAQSLRAQGQEVALILLDSVISQGAAGLRPLFKKNGVSPQRGLRETISLLKLSRREWLKIPQLILDRDIPDWVPASKRRVALALAKAKAKYRYSPYDGSVLLIECATPDGNYNVLSQDGMLGWNGLFQGPVTRRKAETSHFELMRDPYVKQLAVILESFFTDAAFREN